MSTPKPDWNRPPGILTKKDRLYLRGEDVPETKQARYERRKGIRKRITNGLLDFWDIWEMDRDERRKINDELWNNSQLYTSLVYMISFAYYSSMDGEYELEQIIQGAVQTAMYEDGTTVRRENPEDGTIDVLEGITVSISPEFRRMPTSDKLLENLREGTILSPNELGILIGSGKMTEEDWNRVWEEYGPGSE